jgi:hypothetical protein
VPERPNQTRNIHAKRHPEQQQTKIFDKKNITNQQAANTLNTSILLGANPNTLRSKAANSKSVGYTV